MPTGLISECHIVSEIIAKKTGALTPVSHRLTILDRCEALLFKAVEGLIGGSHEADGKAA